MSLDSLRIVRLGLIALLAQTTTSIQGRKRIQKMMYLVDGIGWNSVTDFKFHYYGTYSESLAQEVQGMVNNGWLKENATGELHNYYVKNRNVVNAMIGRLRSINEQRMEISISLIRELDKYSTDMLEVSSTLVYLRKEKPELNDNQLIALAQELKPQFDSRLFKNGLKIFSLLKSYSVNSLSNQKAARSANTPASRL